MKRTGLVFSLALSFAAAPQVVWADDDDEEEEEDDEDEEDDEEEEEEEDQPPVTAGGLYTLETYPQAELKRPLTMTKGINQFRAGIDMDLSAKTAFETWGLAFNFKRGLEDNVELQLDFRTQLNNFSDFESGVGSDLDVKAAIEAGIVYDLVDFRLGIDVPFSKTGDNPLTPGVTEPDASKTRFNFEIGFPFRYAVAEQGGIIALDTLLTFNTDGKPDLTPSLGILAQPHPMLAAIIEAKLVIVDFDTEAENFQIPISIDIQFSPSNKLDIGMEFTFPNLKPAPQPDPMDPTMEITPKFYDSRFLLLYGQIRI